MGAQELIMRLKQFGIPMSEWKRVEFFEEPKSVVDAVDPDGINVIDYLDILDEHWKVGIYLNQVFESLKSGMALVALQKKSSTDIAKGGEVTLERPRLYLSMSRRTYGDPVRILKIIKIKNWRDPKKSPEGFRTTFTIDDGNTFNQQVPWGYFFEEDL
jgi:hypothetical protein